jgi:hypothetical protein
MVPTVDGTGTQRIGSPNEKGPSMMTLSVGG